MNSVDAAQYLGTDARTLRRFVRSPQFPRNSIGNGTQFNFTKLDLDSIKELFEAWQNNKICEGTANPGVWPYVTRCVKLIDHLDDHRDRKGRTWENTQ